MHIPVFLQSTKPTDHVWARYRAIHTRLDGSHYVNIGGLRYSVIVHSQRDGYPIQYGLLTRDYPAEHWGAPWGSLKSYKSVAAYFEKAQVCRTWSENERPLNTSRTRDKVIRKTTGGRFELVHHCATQVTYHPDNVVEIAPFACPGTSSVVDAYTPGSVLVYQCYSGALAVKVKQSDKLFWQDKSVWRIVKVGRQPLRLQINTDGTAAVLNAEEMVPVDVPVLGTERTRALSKEYNFAAAKTWLKSVTTLTNDPDAERLRSEHITVDQDMALDLMREGKFDEAMQYVPLVVEQTYGYAAYRAVARITPGSIECLRRYLYGREGVVDTTPKHIVTVSEYERARYNPYR